MEEKGKEVAGVRRAGKHVSPPPTTNSEGNNTARNPLDRGASALEVRVLLSAEMVIGGGDGIVAPQYQRFFFLRRPALGAGAGAGTSGAGADAKVDPIQRASVRICERDEKGRRLRGRKTHQVTREDRNGESKSLEVHDVELRHRRRPLDGVRTVHNG
jgi:hypothetical protein